LYFNAGKLDGIKKNEELILLSPLSPFFSLFPIASFSLFSPFLFLRLFSFSSLSVFFLFSILF
jgi:hypothetical protein